MLGFKNGMVKGNAMTRVITKWISLLNDQFALKLSPVFRGGGGGVCVGGGGGGRGRGGGGKGYSDDVAMSLAYFIPSLYHTLQSIDDHAVISSHH